MLRYLPRVAPLPVEPYQAKVLCAELLHQLVHDALQRLLPRKPAAEALPQVLRLQAELLRYRLLQLMAPPERGWATNLVPDTQETHGLRGPWVFFVLVSGRW